MIRVLLDQGLAPATAVLLRAEGWDGLDASAQAALIQAVWQHCADAIAEGAAVSADITAVRLRRLPLK